MDKLFWPVWKGRAEKNNDAVRETAVKMDEEKVQGNSYTRSNKETDGHKERKPQNVLSLGKGVLLRYQRITRAV